MTQAEFLAKLAKTPKKGWKLNPSGYIRKTGGLCPIEVVAKVPRGHVARGIKKLGLSQRGADNIIGAADSEWVGRYPLRRKLLKAVGLIIE